MTGLYKSFFFFFLKRLRIYFNRLQSVSPIL